MNGVRATISRQVLCGDLMYVSFSAGSVMAGLTVEINRDDINEVTKAGGNRTKDGFKLIHYLDGESGEEFYDLKNDPEELRNVITASEHAKRLTQMREALQAELKRTEAGFAEAVK
jgi:hypothetical protein